MCDCTTSDLYPSEVREAFAIVPVESDLDVSVVPPPAPVLTGISDWLLAVANGGPDPADDVEFVISLPEGHEFVQIYSGVSCDSGEPIVTCTLDFPLSAGRTFQVIFQTRVTSANEAGIAPDEAAEGVGRFLILLYNYFFPNG